MQSSILSKTLPMSNPNIRSQTKPSQKSTVCMFGVLVHVNICVPFFCSVHVMICVPPCSCSCSCSSYHFCSVLLVLFVAFLSAPMLWFTVHVLVQDLNSSSAKRRWEFLRLRIPSPRQSKNIEKPRPSEIVLPKNKEGLLCSDGSTRETLWLIHATTEVACLADEVRQVRTIPNHCIGYPVFFLSSNTIRRIPLL